MLRRDFLKLIGGTSAVFSIPKPVFSFPLRENEKRLNVLWIVKEDINYDLVEFVDLGVAVLSLAGL